MQVKNLSFNKEESDSVISQVCLAYLLQFNTSQSLDVDLGKLFPLAKYAADYWIIHACASGKKKPQSSAVFVLMMRLLTDENIAFRNWVQLCDIDDYRYIDLQKQRADIADPLYYTSLAGLDETSYEGRSEEHTSELQSRP